MIMKKTIILVSIVTILLVMNTTVVVGEAYPSPRPTSTPFTIILTDTVVSTYTVIPTFEPITYTATVTIPDILPDTGGAYPPPWVGMTLPQLLLWLSSLAGVQYLLGILISFALENLPQFTTGDEKEWNPKIKLVTLSIVCLGIPILSTLLRGVLGYISLDGEELWSAAWVGIIALGSSQLSHNLFKLIWGNVSLGSDTIKSTLYYMLQRMGKRILVMDPPELNEVIEFIRDNVDDSNSVKELIVDLLEQLYSLAVAAQYDTD